jgi:hypothetical protein
LSDSNIERAQYSMVFHCKIRYLKSSEKNSLERELVEKKMDDSGVEPLTSAMPWQRSTN